MTDMIKVSANSLTTAVAGAIAGVMRDHGKADVQAIGASAVNQAVKAIAIARGYLEGDQIDIACIPHFVEVDINGQERTALRFTIEQRPAGAPHVGVSTNGMQHASHHASHAADEGVAPYAADDDELG